MEKPPSVNGKWAEQGALHALGADAVVIPPLSCPFAHTSGRKDAAEIHAASMAWAERHGLVVTEAERRFADGNRIAWGLGLAHPDAPAGFGLARTCGKSRPEAGGGRQAQRAPEGLRD